MTCRRCCRVAADSTRRHHAVSYRRAKYCSVCNAVTNHPLKEVIDAAVRALNLDIDTIVAQAVKNPSQPVNPTQRVRLCSRSPHWSTPIRRKSSKA